MTILRVTKLALPALAAGLLLAGCGAPAPKSKAPTVIGIFTSAQDCASKGKLSLEDCGKLIQKAIDTHQTKAKVYISSRLCEAAEGAGRCERSGETEFRPRLAAFLVTFATPPVSEPLYAPKDSKVVGFATANNAKTLLAVDETLLLTPSAKQIAEGFVVGKRTR